jgi:cell division protein ZapA
VEKRSVVVHVAGQRYVVRSDADEGYVQTLAGYLNDRIAEVRGSTKPVSLQSLVTLAALNITDDLFSEREKRTALKREVKERSVAALKLLDQEVQKALTE